MVLTQRTLVDLINFIDPDWIRFPDPNERGKLPLPPGGMDRKRIRPLTEVARFRYETDPVPLLASWAHERGLRFERCGKSGARVALGRGWRTLRQDVLLLSSPPWVELHVLPHGHDVVYDRPSGPGRPVLSRRQIDVLKSLLHRFDRPTLPHRRRGH